MNLSATWISFLKDRGHEAQHWSAIGDARALDTEIASYCAEQDIVVLSGDLDFASYHALQGTSKPSVIQLRGKDLLPRQFGPLVARALTLSHSSLIKGAIITIKNTRMRITKLPIGNTEPY